MPTVSGRVAPTPLTKGGTAPYAHAMRAWRPDWGVCRAVIAVAVLYALCLQALLGSVAPSSQVSFNKIICAEHAGTDAPADKGLPCRHTCCTLVHAVVAPAPVLAFVAMRWSPGDAVPLAWRAGEPRAARAPPDQSVSPRGPPTA